SGTPDAFASERGKGRPSISTPYSSIGARTMPQRTIQPTAGRPKSGKRLSSQPTTAPSTSPPGQPAWRMFSQCVLLRGNSVAVSVKKLAQNRTLSLKLTPTPGGPWSAGEPGEAVMPLAGADGEPVILSWVLMRCAYPDEVRVAERGNADCAIIRARRCQMPE